MTIVYVVPEKQACTNKVPTGVAKMPSVEPLDYVDVHVQAFAERRVGPNLQLRRCFLYPFRTTPTARDVHQTCAEYSLSNSSGQALSCKFLTAKLDCRADRSTTDCAGNTFDGVHQVRRCCSCSRTNAISHFECQRVPRKHENGHSGAFGCVYRCCTSRSLADTCMHNGRAGVETLVLSTATITHSFRSIYSAAQLSESMKLHTLRKLSWRQYSGFITAGADTS